MSERPLCVLIGALGGQGGGVLTNWLVETARAGGYPAQATSIPGVAQRTGATTYYFELFPQPNPPADPVFSPYPGAGDVDLVAALEPTEAGRALERGYVTGGTTVVTSTARVYSTAEKSVAGDGIVPLAPVLEKLAETATNFITIDPALLPGSQVNALLFGTIIGSGVLPFSADAGRAAIEAIGLAVPDNLAGFEVGLAAAEQPEQDSDGQPSVLPPASSLRYEDPPPGFADCLAPFPAALHPLLGHSLARLVEYQDERYARRYLARLQPVLAADAETHGFRLTAEVARRLAAWMSYEDAIRVAQLKTKAGRLARIRAEVGAQSGEPVAVTDFLSPSRHEMESVLPAPLTRLIPGNGEANGQALKSIPLAWPTSSPWGYAFLKVLGTLRPLRRHSRVFAREQEAIGQWLDAVTRAAAVNYELACQTAALAAWARGYGEIRERGLARLERLFAGWSQRLKEDEERVTAEVERLLVALRHEPDACRGGREATA